MSKQKNKGQRQNQKQEPVDAAELATQQAHEAHGTWTIEGNGHASVVAQEQEDTDGTAGLAVLLGYLVAYLCSKVDVDDLDVLSFSLHHLFCCVDSLYRTALPSLATSLAPNQTDAGVIEHEENEREGESAYRPQTWIQLQALKQTIRRMQPLCQLLNDAGERILGSLGYAEQTGADETHKPHEPLDETDRSGEAASKRSDGIHLQDGASATERESEHDEQGSGYAGYVGYATSSESIERALRDLVVILTAWQQRYRNLPSFKALLCELFPTIPLSISPDTSFMQLLDNASTLFGDILPAFQAISTGDDEAVIMLLFDFLQQTDLLAIQFKMILELLNMLIEQCTIVIIMN